MSTSKQEKKESPKSKELTPLDKANLITLFAKVAATMAKKAREEDKSVPDSS